MAGSENNNFDIQALLKVPNLDLRKVSRDHPSLKTNDYFISLAKYVNHAPPALDTLKRISSEKTLEGGDLRQMKSIKDMLEEIGCNKYSIVIDEITSACKRGHIKFAAESTKKILDELLEIFFGVTEAKRDNETKIGEERKELPLKNILNLFDIEDSYRKKRILAVDDSAVMLKTIASVLKDKYEVYTMTNPMTIEKVLEQVTPDLFILDYKMPERSGFECVPIIRSFREHKETPIIFLTSLGTADYVSAAFSLGACDFVVKPFQGNVLLDKIEKHLGKKK